MAMTCPCCDSEVDPWTVQCPNGTLLVGIELTETSQPPSEGIAEEVIDDEEQSKALLRGRTEESATRRENGWRMQGPDWTVAIGRELRVGRDEEWAGQFALRIRTRDAISRQHAVLRCDGDHCTVEDVGSTNGTRVDGEPIDPGVRRELDDGTTIDFSGDLRVTVART